ncbi:alcohol dehydrogenase class-3 [Striga asiatica]|uniref:Alcohol dehydrogenase class-3 n=1 Tax=Striga asiatica TaxID=4170 RepID=A0A5A7RKS4_STRAF|nr:alcohol dehydrogenase class-3 [Striga asiatica]
MNMAVSSACTSIPPPAARKRQFPTLPLSGFAPYSNLRFAYFVNPNQRQRRLLLNRFSTSSAPVSTLGTTDEIDSPRTSTAVGEGSGVGGGWPEFSDKISGEWDGFGADFTVEGKPVHLPESVVPEAFREWEVEVFDWQTQCPTLAQPHKINAGDEPPSFFYKTIKLLPTVGCEADAATTHSIQERHVSSTSTSTFAFAYHRPTGSYVALWSPLSGESPAAELEHCLIDPSNRESRVRVVQALGLGQDGSVELRGLSVFVEQWYGPFRNGDQLGGCAIRDSAFAATRPLDSSQVSGLVWEGLTSVADFRASHNTMVKELGDECVSETIRDESDLILLPKQLWCSVKKAESGTICFEVGWLLDQGRAITSKCTFSNAQLKEIALAVETATVK